MEASEAEDTIVVCLQPLGMSRLCGKEESLPKKPIKYGKSAIALAGPFMNLKRGCVNFSLHDAMLEIVGVLNMTLW